MLTVEHNGLEIEQISPSKGEKFSPNLYRWLKKQRTSWALRVYRDTDNTLWIGMLDGCELIGTRLIGVLCNGAHENTAAWQNIHAVEVPNFWANYVSGGRCAIDIDHSMRFINDESRWKVLGDHRECQWCGKASQHLVRQSNIIETTEWVNQCKETSHV